MGFGSMIRGFDTYQKVESEFRKKTFCGGVVTILSATIIFYLVYSEFSEFLRLDVVHELAVDTSREKTMDIYLNVDFPSLPCVVLSLDAMDSFGKHQLNIVRNVQKSRLDKNGIILGQEKLMSTYDHLNNHLEPSDTRPMDVHMEGPPSGDADQHYIPMSEREKALMKRFEEEKDEGCSVNGFLTVSKVSGNFHFSVHATDITLLENMFGSLEKVNISHTIHQLTFGPEVLDIGGALNGEVKVNTESTGIFSYNLKVVPTWHYEKWGPPVKTNQYSVSDEFQPFEQANSLPAVYFNYDMSPIMVNIRAKEKYLYQFIVEMCAIVGGVYTVSSMLESFLYHGAAVFRKDHLGKLT